MKACEKVMQRFSMSLDKVNELQFIDFYEFFASSLNEKERSSLLCFHCIPFAGELAFQTEKVYLKNFPTFFPECPIEERIRCYSRLSITAVRWMNSVYTKIFHSQAHHIHKLFTVDGLHEHSCSYLTALASHPALVLNSEPVGILLKPDEYFGHRFSLLAPLERRDMNGLVSASFIYYGHGKSLDTIHQSGIPMMFERSLRIKGSETMFFGLQKDKEHSSITVDELMKAVILTIHNIQDLKEVVMEVKLS
jgi:hypothetical protein